MVAPFPSLPYCHYAEVFVTRPMMDTAYLIDPREHWDPYFLYGTIAIFKHLSTFNTR
jgi:hypothetical protein